MKKLCKAFVMSFLLACLCCVGAQAMENNMLKVGIKFGNDAMFSANLQNYNDTVAGLGYTMGYFDSARNYIPLGIRTDEYKISVTCDGSFYASGSTYYEGGGGVGGWHLQLQTVYATYDEAAMAAAQYDGAFVAFLSDAFAVRVGQYYSMSEAEAAALAWNGADAVRAVSPSRTGVVVTVTGTNRVLFYFDCGGLRSLAVMPQSVYGEKPVTWFRGYRYYGGFEYQRVTGGKMNVINVVNIEDYVKGSVPWEIGNDKPLEAIKAQAVCARTYAAMQTRHRSQGFDVCTTVDCQVYQGVAAGNEITDQAVDETAGLFMYYDGKYAEAYYYSSNGGASEDAKNVWGDEVGYLKGKADPYEAYVASRISKYNWTTTFTKDELTNRLSAMGVKIGTVKNVYVSEYTPNGNVYSLTFEGTGGSKTYYRESCRVVLGLRSQRYGINGGSAGEQQLQYYINDTGNAQSSVQGLYIISGDGVIERYDGGSGDIAVMTASGISELPSVLSGASAGTQGGETFTFKGSGWGHNVGMSQWGAVAMAELGYSFLDILQFYFTGVVIG